MRLRCSLAVACAGCLCSAHLWAQPISGAPAGDRVILAGDRAIEDALREQAQRARAYRYTWTGINSALTIGTFAALPWVDHAARPDFVVGGVGSLISTVATFVLPLRVEAAEQEIAAFDHLSATTRSEKLRQLLRADAEDEREHFALPWHAFNLGASAIAGGVLVFGFHRTTSGVATGVASFVLGEIQLFTQPTALTDKAFQAPGAGLRWHPEIALQNRAFSVGIGARF